MLWATKWRSSLRVTTAQKRSGKRITNPLLPLVLYSPWYKKIEGRGTERRSRGERRETIKFFLKVQQHTTVDWFCSNDHNGVSGYWYEKGINVDQLAPEIGPIIAEVSRFGRGRGELEIEKRIGGEEEEKRRGKEGRGEKEKRGDGRERE
jgi:hypothetical protein